jgi:hypothetical protein
VAIHQESAMDEIDRPPTGEPEPGATGSPAGRPGDAGEAGDGGEDGGAPASGDQPEEDTLLRESPDPPITE